MVGRRRKRHWGFQSHLGLEGKRLCVLPRCHRSTRQRHVLRLYLYLRPHLHISNQHSRRTRSSTTRMAIGRLIIQFRCRFIRPQSCLFIRRRRRRRGVGRLIGRMGCGQLYEGISTKMHTLLYYWNFLSLNSFFIHYLIFTLRTLHCIVILYYFR